MEETQANMADDPRCLALSELLKTEHSGIMLIVAGPPVYFWDCLAWMHAGSTS